MESGCVISLSKPTAPTLTLNVSLDTSPETEASEAIKGTLTEKSQGLVQHSPNLNSETVKFYQQHHSTLTLNATKLKRAAWNTIGSEEAEAQLSRKASTSQLCAPSKVGNSQTEVLLNNIDRTEFIKEFVALLRFAAAGEANVGFFRKHGVEIHGTADGKVSGERAVLYIQEFSK